MKKYKYIGAIIAVLILFLTITLMTVNELVVLCRLEPVDAHNLLAVQNAIIYTVIKTIILTYITYFIAVELYYEVQVKPIKERQQVKVPYKARSGRIVRIPTPLASMNPVQDTKEPLQHNKVSDLIFEPVEGVKSVAEYMNTQPSRDDFDDMDEYYKELDVWQDSLPNDVKVNWGNVYAWKSWSTKDSIMPTYIRDLVNEGYCAK